MNVKQLAAMRAHVDAVRALVPHAIVLFRLGDFYEAIGTDATVLRAVFDITPIVVKIDGERIPVAGVPYHAIHTYAATLAEQGYSPIRCETPATLPIAAT